MPQEELRCIGKQCVVYCEVRSSRNSGYGYIFCVLAAQVLYTWFISIVSMSKEGSSKVSMKVPAEYERDFTTPKFKQRKVSVVRDFPPGCRRGTASDFRLHRQIAVNQFNQCKYSQFLS
ncbi:hypothetical protein J1N35_000890 [Gossypium stocksii]|uniref:Uncharacterized protein n=1 Tax=Gossypium stocksii TaxID=47602 RepID=A0A9D4AKJ0_9ROSI|nr:hypothetical protein J1N35_000890 [Gossypium stocksii]